MIRQLIFLLVLFPFFAGSQGVLPVHRYHVQKGPLDEISHIEPSFGLSLRRIGADYTGFALRLRRSSDNALADVAFDDEQGLVTANSEVTLVSDGSTTTLSGFAGASNLFVRTWYDQNGNTGFNAVQAVNNRQPRLVFNSAGTGNDKPSILFNGNSWLEINQGVQNILGGGIRGSFILWTRPTSNAPQFSFGARFPDDWRWTFHINWNDGRVYFDSAESCCAVNRSFLNSTNLNQYNSYTFIRGTGYKTARVSSAPTALNNAAAASTAKTGGAFWLGWNWPGNSQRYQGNLSEVLMFKTDVSQADALLVEDNQINFWQ
ncbi:hypothetical protein [Ostreibacterium oceani]|uniref:Uncharacterized protein n=1 Tax=Ostreibacterium oceani TaxID=2654998 RepID=A0A6N7EZN8_9GAMM|nr:hypothetical protein [Ostreibacterium oceani]MPV86985.1 hypothetical protein [Ostreibacterium oceani]